MIKELSKKALYASGLLGLYHRIRNADTLTVVMFHRILPPADPRFASCDPDYTLATDVFGQCLEFFERHYNVVSEADVLASRESGSQLPRNALLITFDDGWSDNADHALAVMRKFGFPGLLFVVSDVIGRRQPFVQECLVSSFRRGALTVARLSEAIDRASGSTVPPGKGGGEGIGALRSEIERFEALAPAQCAAVAEILGEALDDGMRHMVDVDDLRKLREGGIALGLHGKTHIRMTRVDDLDAELDGARKALSERMETPRARSMSFPHGAYDDAIARRARDTGYDLVFTSRRLLNRAGGGVGWLLGRTGFETETVVDAKGEFRPDLLALELFRCRRGRLLD